MKDFKGTKGPMYYERGSIYCRDMWDTKICDISYDINDEVTEANGRLLAAAPDLLEALQQLLFVCQHPGDLGLEGIDAAANANASIKKALGE